MTDKITKLQNALADFDDLDCQHHVEHHLDVL